MMDTNIPPPLHCRPPGKLLPPSDWSLPTLCWWWEASCSSPSSTSQPRPSSTAPSRRWGPTCSCPGWPPTSSSSPPWPPSSSAGPSSPSSLISWSPSSSRWCRAWCWGSPSWSGGWSSLSTGARGEGEGEKAVTRQSYLVDSYRARDRQTVAQCLFYWASLLISPHSDHSDHHHRQRQSFKWH